MDSRLKTLVGALVLFAVVIGIVLVAQGGGDDEGDDAAATSGEKPTVEVPEGDPPTELEIEDIEEGDGAEAQEGDQVTVDYVGVLYENGEEFDSSYNTGQPFQFQLGAGMVIPGWDEGVAGMKEGGRRQLVIPPDQAYGRQGSPPTIPPNSTLVFIVDLISVDSASG